MPRAANIFKSPPPKKKQHNEKEFIEELKQLEEDVKKAEQVDLVERLQQQVNIQRLNCSSALFE